MEQLKHECGVAMIRLLKPLDYYEKKYGTWAYGFNKLYLMMEKQHNRGQEGAGIASVNLNNKPGTEYMFREKAEGKNAITEIFSRVTEEMKGELLMGHLLDAHACGVDIIRVTLLGHHGVVYHRCFSSKGFALTRSLSF